jgi:hypothetical protein
LWRDGQWGMWRETFWSVCGRLGEYKSSGEKGVSGSGDF